VGSGEPTRPVLTRLRAGLSASVVTRRRISPFRDHRTIRRPARQYRRCALAGEGRFRPARAGL